MNTMRQTAVHVTSAFQPLLDAVRGYEVLTFLTGPAASDPLESVSDGKGRPSLT